MNTSTNLKNRTRISTTLSNDTLKMLKEYSDESLINMSKIIDAAVVEYIKKRTTT